MKILSYAVLAGVLLGLSGCDDAMNKPKTESRTMIIGGVPVHDRNYKMIDSSVTARDQLKQ
ncbi:NF038215 family lipoprotein [Acinetobacter pecorum]|uniref:NF038215 family lipoprotein n=1 Tax=Acinetobacter pecorum TaxID=2762215 RepID=UPI00119E4FDC